MNHLTNINNNNLDVIKNKLPEMELFHSCGDVFTDSFYRCRTCSDYVIYIKSLYMNELCFINKHTLEVEHIYYRKDVMFTGVFIDNKRGNIVILTIQNSEFFIQLMSVATKYKDGRVRVLNPSDKAREYYLLKYCHKNMIKNIIFDNKKYLAHKTDISIKLKLNHAEKQVEELTKQLSEGEIL